MPYLGLGGFPASRPEVCFGLGNRGNHVLGGCLGGAFPALILLTSSMTDDLQPLTK